MASKTVFGSVPVFRPTLEEFKDFSAYVRSIWAVGSQAGLVKVIPPAGWSPRPGPKETYLEATKHISIPVPIQQVLNGRQGKFEQLNVEQPAMTVAEFAKAAAQFEEDSRIDGLDVEGKEEKFWKSLHFQPPTYGADMLGSLFDPTVEVWNPQKLKTLLDLIPQSMSGINRPYLYFGMWKAMFGWHTEENSMNCKMFLRHKTTVIKPHILAKQHNITVNSCLQNTGEFMITFPYSYHAGFNYGYNCAESVNFATAEWIEYGKRSKPCTPGLARIDMDIFQARYQLFCVHGKDGVTEDMVWEQMKGNGKLERLFKKDQEEEQKQLGEQQKQERNKKRKRSASEAKGKIKAAANVTMTNTHKKQCPKIIEDRDYVPEVTKRSPKKAKKTSMLDSPSSNNGIPLQKKRKRKKVDKREEKEKNEGKEGKGRQRGRRATTMEELRLENLIEK